MPDIRVKIIQNKQIIETVCQTGVSVHRFLADLGINLDTYCGGSGTCGKCQVTIQGKISPPTPTEKNIFSPAELKMGKRLACQSLVQGSCEITVPKIKDKTDQNILVTGQKQKVAHDPIVKVVSVQLAEPKLNENPADFENIKNSLGRDFANATIPLKLLSFLPNIIRNNNYKIKIVSTDDEILDIIKSDSKSELFGVAFDIGTTTIVGKLYDLTHGQLLAVAAQVNAQRVFGEDVISRIDHAMKSETSLKALQNKVIESINTIIAELCEIARIKKQQIYIVICAGNTAMTHLALAVNPQYLAQMPYVPAFKGAMYYECTELGLTVHPQGRIYFLPAIGRFVGGDTVAVILATDLDKSKKARLAIDIGTNGEIVLAWQNNLFACSTAAGPAFEGAHIEHGMRASPGAIDAVNILNGELHFHVISEQKAEGICGSGLIDAIAELLRVGVIDISGRIQTQAEIAGKVPHSLANRLVKGETGIEFTLEQNEKKIVITQKDVREIQLAKGAIAAGIRLMLDKVGIQVSEISEVLLAGAFGNFIRRENAIRIGLLPDIEPAKVRFVGNAACAGAEMILLSKNAKQNAEEIANKVEYIEISANTEFQEYFADEMLFPEI